jgi:hypothetical protein
LPNFIVQITEVAIGGVFSGVEGKGNIRFWATLMEMVHIEEIVINGRITSKFSLRKIGW